MTQSKFILLLFVALMSQGVHGNPAQYNQSCASCHGAQGEGNAALKAPSIAGLNANYIQRQLHNFKNGIRGQHPQDSSGQMMAAMSKGLTAHSIESLANYLAAKPFQAAKPSDKSAGFIGAGQYPSCQSCHGAKAQGEPNLGAPRLAGQHTWYLKAQLDKFKQGIRGNHKDDKHGKQMVSISQNLNNEKKLEMMLIHISQQKPTTQASNKGH